MDKDLIKKIIKDILRNFVVAIVLGNILFTVILLYIEDFSGMMHWFYVSIALVTAGTVCSIIYGIIKYRQGIKNKLKQK